MYEVRIKRPTEREMSRLPEAMFKRIGEYRVLYTIDDESRQIEIVAVGHRREVYRGM